MDDDELSNIGKGEVFTPAKSAIPHYSNEKHVGESVLLIGKGKVWKKVIFSSSNEKHLVLVSGHKLRWVWRIEGKTFRKPLQRVRMRNWNRDIHFFHGIKVILNTQRAEFWLQARKSRSVERMIYGAWSKADKLAREFSLFAGIALKPMESARMAGCQDADIVNENPVLNKALVPLLDGPGRKGVIPYDPEGVGLHEDISHRKKAEADGKKSIEGQSGLEWVLLRFKAEWALAQQERQEKAMQDNDRWQDLEASIALLNAQQAKLAEGEAAIIKAVLKIEKKR